MSPGRLYPKATSVFTQKYSSDRNTPEALGGSSTSGAPNVPVESLKRKATWTGRPSQPHSWPSMHFPAGICHHPLTSQLPLDMKPFFAANAKDTLNCVSLQISSC